MSIKNIIQQENDLQEMSQQSLANYLNNPTGQYNPYLVAGELQRKEQYAERKMVEAPQQTVVDELVQNTMPMGGMPTPPSMPMPRPQETMVSDTITETGIASLPAPNIGQNYAEGGIIGYDDGGIVYSALDYADRGLDYAADALDNPVVQGIETVLFPKFSLAAGLLPQEVQAAEMYDFNEDGTRTVKPEVQALIDEQNIAEDVAIGSAGVAGTLAAKQKLKSKSAAKKLPKSKSSATMLGLKELVKKAKDKLKPTPKKKTATPPATPKKKLTKKEQDAFLKKQKTPPQTALEKANQFKKPSTKGPATQGIIDAAKYMGPKIGPLTRAAGRGIRNYPVEIAGTVGAGFGIDALLNEGVLYGDTPEETAAAEAKALYDSPPEVRKREDAARAEQAFRAQQIRADEQEAARKRKREKEMYLALALGGAKTMAGQSPFALTNIGEGLGAGVGALAAYDQNEIERMTASQNATIKARQDLQIAMADYENDYREGIRELDDNAMYNDELEALEDYGYTDADLALAKEALLRKYVGLPTSSYFANINGQQFTAVE